MNPESLFINVCYAAIVIMSIVLHEIAHGWVAYQCGDDTAYLMGRLSLNPLKHIDPFMTILLPLLCIWLGFPAFGGAKPVPVNPYRFRHPGRDDRLVSIAGVAVNLAIAFVLAQALRLSVATGVFQPDSPGAHVLVLGIISNLVLFVFNLTPIPPLDGSRVLRTFLPFEAARVFNMMDRWGLIIVFIVAQSNKFWMGMMVVIGLLWHYVLMMPANLL